MKDRDLMSTNVCRWWINLPTLILRLLSSSWRLQNWKGKTHIPLSLHSLCFSQQSSIPAERTWFPHLRGNYGFTHLPHFSGVSHWWQWDEKVVLHCWGHPILVHKRHQIWSSVSQHSYGGCSGGSRVKNGRSVTNLWLTCFDDWFCFYEPFIKNLASAPLPKVPTFFARGWTGPWMSIFSIFLLFRL